MQKNVLKMNTNELQVDNTYLLVSLFGMSTRAGLRFCWCVLIFAKHQPLSYDGRLELLKASFKDEICFTYSEEKCTGIFFELKVEGFPFFVLL